MTALSANKKTARRDIGVLVALLGALPVAASTHIYAGAMVALNLSGYIVPASADASLVVLGIAEFEADNSSGSAGALTVDVRRECALLVNSSSTNLLTTADIGRPCYVVDDQTVARTSSLGLRPVAGRVIDVQTEGVYVELGVDPFAHNNIDIYLPAGADLSSKQYYAVELGSGGTVTVNNAAGEPVLGILQNAPASGAIARVRVAGITSWIASTTIATGVRLKTTNAGKSAAASNTTADASGASATAALTGSNVVGISLTDGAADTAHQVLIQQQGAVPGTAA